jgi:betaine lipid synthase
LSIFFYYIGSAYSYVVNTFDPVIKSTLLRDDNYFYYMPLMLKYRPNNCPAYLTEEGFNTLREDTSRLDAIKIHTRTIVEVLENEVADGELTKVILMDHLDWFSNEDADGEISMVARKMAKGGRVFWRSAGKYPWYNSIFEARGFKVSPCQIREGETMYIDRVNMYASFVSTLCFLVFTVGVVDVCVLLSSILTGVFTFFFSFN